MGGIKDNKIVYGTKKVLFPNLGLADAYRAVFYSPRSPAAHNTLGTVLQALGLRDAARVEYERTLALDPGAAYAMNNICSLDLLEERPASAAAACRRALDIQPALVVALHNLEKANAMLRAAPGGDPDGRQ